MILTISSSSVYYLIIMIMAIIGILNVKNLQVIIVFVSVCLWDFVRFKGHPM